MSESRLRLSVRELIEQLQRMPPDAEVFTEGCDCYGDADHVVLEDKLFGYSTASPVVVIARDNDRHPAESER